MDVMKKKNGPCLSWPRHPVSLPCGQPYWNKLCHHIEQLRGLEPTEIDKLEQILRGIQRVTEEESTQKPPYHLPSAGGEFYFGGLIHFLEHDASSEEREAFFGSILPTIVMLAVEIEQLKPKEVLHYCSQQQDGNTQISRRFASCLVAHSFLCTLPPQTSVDLNQINFRFFFKHLENLSLQKAQAAKLRCILNYFSRLSGEQPSGNLVITRKVFPQELMSSMDTWETSDVPLCAFIVKQEGAIESAGSGIVQVRQVPETDFASYKDHHGVSHLNCEGKAVRVQLEVDFANRYVGGGVLSSGLVQEEIRFITCPELIACLPFVECMQDNEAVQISGFEQYCDYSGYSHSFSFDGDHRDDAEVDSLGNLETTLVAIDASEFYDTSDDQYRENYLLRDLNKAFIGFLPAPENDTAESTGGSDDDISFHTVGTEKSRLTAETDFETASEGFEITTTEQGGSYDLGCITNYGNALSKAITHIAVKDASILQSGESPLDYSIGKDGDQLPENLIDSEREEAGVVGADWMLLTENSYLSRELKNFCEKLTGDLILSVLADSTLKRRCSTQEEATGEVSEGEGPDGSGDHGDALDSQQEVKGEQVNLKCLVNDLVSSAVNEALQEKRSQPSPENGSVHSGVSSSVGDFSVISSISGHSETFVKVGRNGECNDLVPLGSVRENMVEKYVSEVIGQAVSVVKRLDNIEEERHLSVSSDRPIRDWRARRQGDPPTDRVDENQESHRRDLETAWNDAGVRNHLLHNLGARNPAGQSESAVRGAAYIGPSDYDDGLPRALPLQGPVVNIEHPDVATPDTPPPSPSFVQSEQSSRSNFSEADFLIFGEELLDLQGRDNRISSENHLRTEMVETFSDEYDDYMDDDADSELDHMFAMASRRSSSRSGSASSKPPNLDSFTEGLLKIANIDPQGRRPSRTEESLQYFSAELAKRAERDRYNLRRESDLDRFTFDLFHVMGVAPKTGGERQEVNEEVAVTCASRLSADIMQDVAIQMFGTVFPHSVRLIPAREGDFPPRREPSEVDILSLAANLANTILESAMHNNQRDEMDDLSGPPQDRGHDMSESIPDELESEMNSRFAQVDENSVCESTVTEDMPPLRVGTEDVQYSSVDEMAWNVSSIIVSDALVEVRKLKLLQELYERSISVEQRPLATGNWGCGVFGGDPQVKALIQWMAASQAGVRTVYYHSFDDKRVEELPEVVQLLRMRGWSVGQTARYLREYCEKRLAAIGDLPEQDLFREILGLKLLT